MNILGLAKRFAARQSLTIKWFEFPDDRPFSVLPSIIGPLLTPEFQVVQIGANDGSSNDPAAEIIRRNRLRAICVEPIVPMYKKLVAFYSGFPRVTCENCAIGSADGEIDLYAVKPDPSLPEYVTQLASFDRQLLLQHRRAYPHIVNFIERVRVPALTLDSLLRKHTITRLDWMQIDAEGFDFEIIKMLFATRFRPSVISFESFNLHRADKIACAAALRDQGYQYVTIGHDTIALKILNCGASAFSMRPDPLRVEKPAAGKISA